MPHWSSHACGLTAALVFTDAVCPLPYFYQSCVHAHFCILMPGNSLWSITLRRAGLCATPVLHILSDIECQSWGGLLP